MDPNTRAAFNHLRGLIEATRPAWSPNIDRSLAVVEAALNHEKDDQ